jgi:hypothetical protein
MNYTVKNIKSFKGMEGLGFNASLYRDDKKVAFVVDSAQGGCLDFEWVDSQEPAVNINITNRDGLHHTYKGTPEEKILAEYVNSLPKIKFFGKGLKVDSDMFVTKLVEDSENEKRLKRMCRTKTLVRTKECKDEEYYSYNTPFTPKTKEFITNEHGDNLIEIINERFIEKTATNCGT